MYKAFVESLKDFLLEVESTHVGERPLTGITIDVKAGKVDLSFEDAEPKGCGSLLAVHEKETEYLKSEWLAEFEKWQKRHYSGITCEDYQERSVIELKELLNSSFLMPEIDSLNKDKLAKASAELEKMNLPVEQAPKYALLCDLLDAEDGIFSFADTQRLELYLADCEYSISKKAVVAFVRFKYVMELISPYLCKNENDSASISSQDQALLKRILDYVPCGEWRMPATCDNVRLFFTELMENAEFRDFFKDGRAGSETDRVEVSLANILGYLMSYQLLAGGQKQISTDFFGYDIQVNNINKGKNGEGSQTFKNLIPLMDKYRVQVIGV